MPDCVLTCDLGFQALCWEAGNADQSPTSCSLDKCLDYWTKGLAPQASNTG